MPMKGEAALPRFTIRAGMLGDGPQQLELHAEDEERRAIASHAGVAAIERLHAQLDLSRWRRGGARARGWLEATVVQPCVVTLEPLKQEIGEEMDIRFLPADEENRRPAENGATIVGPDDEDPPDLFSGPAIDLWPAVIERLLLAIEYYPRAPDAELDSEIPSGEDEAGDDSPFAALGQLRHRKKSEDG
jgi:uncharacterized metal-binding protein YceD (DUF177 family)